MSSLLEYIPGIPKAYWQDYVKAIEPTKPTVILPGQRQVTLINGGLTDRRGVILEFALNSNNPNLEFFVVADNRRIHATITQLYDAGYTFYIPNLPFISEYNTTENIYVVNLITELPFNSNIDAYVTNTTTSQIIIGSMGFHAIIFNPGFYKALADLKNGKETS